jgi:glucose/mannose-6-phosphate isomerase
LNENAKMLGWSNVLPEMNHNEILGWSRKHENIAVVFFRNDDDYGRISKRIDLTKEVVLQYAGSVIEIYSKGNSLIERVFYSIHMGDWISLILAEMEKVDPNEIRMIENFKASLAGS